MLLKQVPRYYKDLQEISKVVNTYSIPTTRTWTFVNCPCPEQFEEQMIGVEETCHWLT